MRPRGGRERIAKRKEPRARARARRSRSQGRVSIALAKKRTPGGIIGVKRALGSLAPVDSRPVVAERPPPPRSSAAGSITARMFVEPSFFPSPESIEIRRISAGRARAVAHLPRAPEFTLPCKLGLTSWTRARALCRTLIPLLQIHDSLSLLVFPLVFPSPPSLSGFISSLFRLSLNNRSIFTPRKLGRNFLSSSTQEERKTDRQKFRSIFIISICGFRFKIAREKLKFLI